MSRLEEKCITYFSSKVSKPVFCPVKEVLHVWFCYLICEYEGSLLSFYSRPLYTHRTTTHGHIGPSNWEWRLNYKCFRVTPPMIVETDCHSSSSLIPNPSYSVLVVEGYNPCHPSPIFRVSSRKGWCELSLIIFNYRNVWSVGGQKTTPWRGHRQERCTEHSPGPLRVPRRWRSGRLVWDSNFVGPRVCTTLVFWGYSPVDTHRLKDGRRRIGDPYFPSFWWVGQ